jgi:hypothetical protein
MAEQQDKRSEHFTQGPNPSVIGGVDDVVRHPAMTKGAKRETLARWASDAHAVENLPTLRQLDDGSVVKVSEILAALKALDGLPDDDAGGEIRHWSARPRTAGRLLSRLHVWRRPGDDDDDPPPCPAAAALPVRFPAVEAIAA